MTDSDDNDETETHDDDNNETQTECLVHTSLVARIEYLESVNATLKGKDKKKHHFCIENIKDDDKMVCFYTGFKSSMLSLSFLGINLNFLQSSRSPVGISTRQSPESTFITHMANMAGQICVHQT